MNSDDATTISIEKTGRTFVLLQKPRSNDHAFSLWDAGIGFAGYLEINNKLLNSMRGKRILELGSGTAFVSMVLASAGAHVLATDLPHVVDAMKACVAANGFKLGMSKSGSSAAESSAASVERAGSIDVAALSWGSELEDVERIVNENGPFDVIVGTDVVYQDRLVRPLLQTAALVALLSASHHEGTNDEASPSSPQSVASKAPGKRKSTVIYFANEERDAVTHALFEKLSKELFGAKLLPSKSYHPDSADTSLRIYEGRLKPGSTKESIASALSTA